jgi:hypothetical protein
MKLSIDSLREKSETIASKELLNSINGGVQDECHRGDCGDYDGDDILLPPNKQY